MYLVFALTSERSSRAAGAQWAQSHRVPCRTARCSPSCMKNCERITIAILINTCTHHCHPKVHNRKGRFKSAEELYCFDLSCASTALGSMILYNSTISMCWSSAAVQMRALSASFEKTPVLARFSSSKSDRLQAMHWRASSYEIASLRPPYANSHAITSPADC